MRLLVRPARRGACPCPLPRPSAPVCPLYLSGRAAAKDRAWPGQKIRRRSSVVVVPDRRCSNQSRASTAITGRPGGAGAVGVVTRLDIQIINTDI